MCEVGIPETERTALLLLRQLTGPCGTVLLVDDIVDSRWTMTAIGWLLREAGSGPVYPFALADTAGRSV